jgi:uncharacterized protein with HEPN domain
MARRVTVILDEIIDAIDGIQSATAGKQFSEFSESWLLRHGVQRGLEIISEASRHLPDELLAQTPEIPWKQIRGIGNLLRHEYHKMSDAIVWAVVTDSLPPLREATVRIRSNLGEEN